MSAVQTHTPPASLLAEPSSAHNAVDLGVPPSALPRVVVVGGGFAGLNLIQHLDGKCFQTVLLDRNNFHTFQPLLYQVATAGLEPASIAAPFRSIFKRKKNFHFRMAEVLRVSPEDKQVYTRNGPLHYDMLVLCHGSITNYFGDEAMKKVSLDMKTIPNALDIRSLVLENFEDALVTDDLQAQRAMIDVVIVGGGPTGVELAGAFAELRRHVLPRDYPDLDVSAMNIHLIELAPRLLGGFSDASAKRALEMLQRMGVEVHLNVAVERTSQRTVYLADGRSLDAGMLIWAAGVRANAMNGLNAEDLLAKGERIKTDRFLRVTRFDGIYALGDVAAVEDDDWPKGHPQMAPPAIQQGKHLARNLKRQLDGDALVPFHYDPPGVMATIGRNHAVVELKHVRLSGFFAWLVWMLVHLMALVSFKNRILVFLEWFHNYMTYDRAFRLIIRNVRRRFTRD